jgi:hypothetical protein
MYNNEYETNKFICMMNLQKYHEQLTYINNDNNNNNNNSNDSDDVHLNKITKSLRVTKSSLHMINTDL